MTHVVCICGSMKSYDVMQAAAVAETLDGNIIVMPFVKKTDAMRELDSETAEMLDALHFAKIEMSYEILVVAVGGYVGESTRKEISFAAEHGKNIRWWQP